MLLIDARFPHPASLTGILEMGSSYLPVNKSFQRYVDRASATYGDIVKKEKSILMELADKALAFGENGVLVTCWDGDCS